MKKNNWTKIKQISKTDTEYADTDYLTGYQYRSSYTQAQGNQSTAVLQYFPHAEGYVQHNEGHYFYVYHYTDHLGNIRLSYGLDPETGLIKIMEENHYYPFGLKHDNYNTQHLGYSTFTDEHEIEYIVLAEMPKFVGDGSYNYKLNGKEYQDELGLNWYDYQARNYDPAIGRWLSVDPMAEQMRRFSSYNYAYNNPIFFLDPDGMAPEDIIYFNNKGKEVHRIASTEVNKAYMITDDSDSKLFPSLTTQSIKSATTVEQAEAANIFNASNLSEATSMSMSFTGDATATGGKDSEGRDKYTATGTLTVSVGFDNGVEATIQSVSADSGPWGFGPTPNGDYTGSSIVNTSESGMLRDGVGFKVMLSDNTDLNRTQLRIHPDQVPSVGTAGCIGITEAAGALSKFKGNVENHFQNNPGTNINVNVSITNNPNYDRPTGGKQNSGE